MARLRSLWLIAPLFAAGACSIINAPADLDPGTGGGGTGGEGGTGGATTSSTTTTTPPAVCGDGKLEGSEVCDDDNTTPGDGCSATCEEEQGYTCTGEPGKLSTCTLNCGNGKLDTGEECDDGGEGDKNNAPGDQDVCDPTCRFKELDLEAAETMVTHESPIVGFRRDKANMMAPEEATFFAIWHTTLPDKVRGRRYRRDAQPLLGTGSEDLSLMNTPDASGHVMCTAPGNRSIVVWRRIDTGTIHSRKIEGDTGALQPIADISIQAVENPTCAVSVDSGTFIAAAMVKSPVGPLWDVVVQPFTSFALPQGTPVDIGDTNAPNDTVSWSLFDGFMVAWVVDAANGGAFSAQPLDKNGAPMGSPVLGLSDPEDVKVAEPFAARVGSGAGDNSFVFGYTREAMDGHREIVFRLFTWTDMLAPPVPSAPVIVSTDPAPQSQPKIALNPMNNKLVIVWTAAVPTGDDVFYATFDSKGVPLKPPTKAPENLIGLQTHPGAAVDPQTGDVLIAWSNDNPSDTKPGRISGKMFPKLLE